MTLLHHKVPPSYIDPPDAEALIRETRRLRRRRWMFASLLIAVVIGGTAVALVTTGGTNGPARTTSLTFHSSNPTVNPKAFSGEGDLAFVSRGALFVLDGTTGSLRRVALPADLVPGTPAFSHDGRWLAFPATPSEATSNGASTLWVANANGTDLHAVHGFHSPGFLGWSPRSDVLAVSSEGEISTTYQPSSGASSVTKLIAEPTSLWVVSPAGGRRELVRTSSGLIDGAAWSPDGSSIAVGGLSGYPFQDHEPWSASLTAYPVNGGKPTLWMRIVNPRSNGCCQTARLKQSQFIPVGWWAHWGIVFWAPSADIGSGLNGGGLPLFALPASGRKPISLGATLAAGQVSPIVASTTGELAISNNAPAFGARPFWQNEQVLRCDPSTLSCAPVKSPPGTISFDPVWSPDGSQLAYLVGRQDADGGQSFNQQAVTSWYDSLSLWRYSTRTGQSTALPAAKGAVVPIWSADSKSLMYIDKDGLWLLKGGSRERPVEVAGPLLPPGNWNPYFAQVPWAGSFAWSRSQNVPRPQVLTPM